MLVVTTDPLIVGLLLRDEMILCSLLVLCEQCEEVRLWLHWMVLLAGFAENH
jgi:hypothetical protein